MNPSQLALTTFESHVADLRRDARRAPSRATAPARRDATRESVAIRLAGARDAAALERLAGLDGAPAPAGPTLLAERRGRVVAAVPLAAGERAIADPFEPTADVLRLLDLRATQLRAGGDRRGPLRALAALLPAHGVRRAA